MNIATPKDPIMKTYQWIILAALFGAACAADLPSREQLTTEHDLALVQTIRQNGVLNSTLLDVRGNAILGEARSIHGDSLLLELPGGDVYRVDSMDPTQPLPDWNERVYSGYALQAWTRDRGDEEAYCHEDARGIGCRGACGTQCNRTTKDWVCLKASAQCGGNGDKLIWFERFKGYTRPCCISHDACYDACKLGWRGIACRRKCDVDAKKAGCGVKDALGKTGDAADAKKKNWYHPTTIACEEDGAVTTDEPTESSVDGGAADNTQLDGEGAYADEPIGGEDHCNGESCEITPTDHNGDGICDEDLEGVWEQEVSMCPETGECTTCVWGS